MIEVMVVNPRKKGKRATVRPASRKTKKNGKKNTKKGSVKMARRKSTRRARKNSWPDSRAGHKKAAKKGWRIRKTTYAPPSYRKSKRRKTTKRNPTYRNYTYSAPKTGIKEFATDVATIPNIAGAAIGAVTVVVVPKLLHMNDGSWKELGVGAGTAIIGGYGIAYTVDREAGKAFATIGLGVVALRGIKYLLGGDKGKYGKYLAGTQDDFVQDAIGELEGLADIGSDEYELFGVGQDSEDDLDMLFGEDDGGLMPTFAGMQ